MQLDWLQAQLTCTIYLHWLRHKNKPKQQFQIKTKETQILSYEPQTAAALTKKFRYQISKLIVYLSISFISLHRFQISNNASMHLGNFQFRINNFFLLDFFFVIFFHLPFSAERCRDWCYSASGLQMKYISIFYDSHLVSMVCSIWIVDFSIGFVFKKQHTIAQAKYYKWEKRKIKCWMNQKCQMARNYLYG